MDNEGFAAISESYLCFIGDFFLSKDPDVLNHIQRLR